MLPQHKNSGRVLLDKPYTEEKMMERKVTIIYGSFFGKNRMYSVIIAITPENMKAEEIIQKGLKQGMYRTIPTEYTAEVIDPSSYPSKDFCDVNVVLLVIP